jgi:hypothetical protein
VVLLSLRLLACARKTKFKCFFLQLLAILLVGSPNDYRLPAIQTFVAPFQRKIEPPAAGAPAPTDPPPPPLSPYNATSLFMIGDRAECVLLKGKGKSEIRVRTVPVPKPDDTKKITEEEENNNKPPAGTFCMLSYQHLNTHMANPTDATKAIEPVKLGEAMDLLQHNEVISVKGCWNPDGYDSSTLEAIEDRQFELLSECV